MEAIAGRTAVVTGAANGIGLATAQALVDAGASVLLTDLDGDELGRHVDRLGGRARAALLDVRDLDAWARAQRAVEGWRGPVDILVNNAGLGPTCSRSPT